MGNGMPVLPPLQQALAPDPSMLNAQLEQNDASLTDLGNELSSSPPSSSGSATPYQALPQLDNPEEPDVPAPPLPPYPIDANLRGVRPIGAPTRSNSQLPHQQAQQSLLAVQGVPAEFWSWKTTAPPPPPPGPNPQVMWIAQTPPPLLGTTPPLYENCYACDCLVVYETDIVQGGSIPDKYSCFGGAPTITVPQFKWAGVPKNTGLDHPIRQADGSECTKSQSFAVTMVDLDWPSGVGQVNNHVRNMFWVVNIPGDWTELSEGNAYTKHKLKPVVVVGRNDAGKLGMEAPCPPNGVHRYMFTLWALKSYIGTELNPVDPNTPFTSILPLLEEKELSRYTFYGTLASQGYSGAASFIQEAASRWFR